MDENDKNLKSELLSLQDKVQNLKEEIQLPKDEPKSEGDLALQQDCPQQTVDKMKWWWLWWP